MLFSFFDCISGQEKHMIERYTNEMTNVETLIRKKIVWRGLVNSFAQTAPLIAYAYAFYYGSHLIASKELHFKNVIKSVETHSHNFVFQIIKIFICFHISL